MKKAMNMNNFGLLHIINILRLSNVVGSEKVCM